MSRTSTLRHITPEYNFPAHIMIVLRTNQTADSAAVIRLPHMIRTCVNDSESEFTWSQKRQRRRQTNTAAAASYRCKQWSCLRIIFSWLMPLCKYKQHEKPLQKWLNVDSYIISIISCRVTVQSNAAVKETVTTAPSERSDRVQKERTARAPWTPDTEKKTQRDKSRTIGDREKNGSS